MKHIFDNRKFEMSYEKFICKGVFNESSEYYPRYRSRYKKLLEIFCDVTSSRQLSILDVGGGN